MALKITPKWLPESGCEPPKKVFQQEAAGSWFEAGERANLQNHTVKQGTVENHRVKQGPDF